MSTALYSFEMLFSSRSSSYLYGMQKLLFLFLLLLSLESCKWESIYETQEPLYQTGDDITWAKSNINDKKWRTERGNTGDSVFWIRMKVSLLKSPFDKLGLQVETFGAYETYWDGVLLGSNGKVAEKGQIEVPSTGTSYLLIPDSLAKPGVHQLALRASQSYEKEELRNVGVKVDDYDALLRRPLIIMSFMNIMAGAFLIAAIYYFFLYANSQRKQPTILIFAIICSLFFALLIAEYLKFYVSIPYPQFYTRLQVIGWLTFAIAFLVPLYFSIHFNLKRRWWLMAVLLATLIFIFVYNYRSYDFTARLYSITMWITSMLVVLMAIYHREKGGVIVLIGLLLSAIVNQFLVYDFGLFICFTLIVLCMLYLNSIRVRQIEVEHQSALLLSSRLKLELIKKNIQPHFLRNTLTSLIDWVEESPKQGVEFIQALAGEFDIMNDISDAQLIPIRQEIMLCKTHLEVMHFRKEVNYEWEENGIDEKEKVPPAIFHTLLENGITHSIALADGRIYFKLSYERGPDYKLYSFSTQAQNRPPITGKSGGNGFIYIKARLTESYGEQWEFNAGATASGWLTTIKIFAK